VCAGLGTVAIEAIKKRGDDREVGTGEVARLAVERDETEEVDLPVQDFADLAYIRVVGPG